MAPLQLKNADFILCAQARLTAEPVSLTGAVAAVAGAGAVAALGAGAGAGAGAGGAAAGIGDIRCPNCSDAVRSRPCSLLTHALNCSAVGKSGRHADVKEALASYWRSYKVAVATEEPKICKYFRPRANMDTLPAAESSRILDRRGDLLVTRVNAPFIMLDVVVTTPHSAPGADPLPAGTAARAQEVKKLKKYEKDFILEKGIFVPFALESYGAWGEQAVDITRVIAAGVLGDDKERISKFERECAVLVSVAVQRRVAAQLRFLNDALRAAARAALVPGGASAAGP